MPPHNPENTSQEISQTQNPFHILPHMNTEEDLHQLETTIHMGGFRSRKHTTLPRAGLPDHAGRLQHWSQKQNLPPHTIATITNKFIHAQSMKTMCSTINLSGSPPSHSDGGTVGITKQVETI